MGAIKAEVDPMIEIKVIEMESFIVISYMRMVCLYSRFDYYDHMRLPIASKVVK